MICGGMLVAILIVTIILGICLKIENRRRFHLSSDKYDREATKKEPCDWVSLYLSTFFHNFVLSSCLASRCALCVVIQKHFSLTTEEAYKQDVLSMNSSVIDIVVCGTMNKCNYEQFKSLFF